VVGAHTAVQSVQLYKEGESVNGRTVQLY
jgi:hypothetical protein